MNVKQKYNQMPQTAWFSCSSSWSWSQLGTRCRIESQRQTEGLGLSVTHGWATQPGREKSAAMVRRTLGQYVAVCPRLQLTSHTQPTSTLSRIKCESYIFIKKCVRSFIEVVIMFDYVPHIFVYVYMYMYFEYTACIQMNKVLNRIINIK